MEKAAERASAPVYLSSFVGREDELRELRLYLESVRLLTITGPGGVGKTRLAAELAGKLEGRYDDGVVFVPLAAVDDAREAAAAIGRAAGLNELGHGDAKQALLAQLRERRVLLILDNLEQARETGALAAELLEACPGVQMLATSRAPLGVRGEQAYPAPPLGLPERGGAEAPAELAGCPAVALFVERARAVRPDFRLDRTTAADVAELCLRLDGLPLAIELAAPRVRLFSPKALRERLGRRLDLLTGGARDMPERHKTLRAAIAWSYELLEPETRALFRRLSAFDGGATVEGAQAVCGADLDCEGRAYQSLGALTDHGLLGCADGRDGEPRFSMLESIRAFGLEKLREHGEEAAVRHAHARHFLELAEEAEPSLTGAGQSEAFERLDAEHENFRAAMQWARHSGDAEAGIRLGGALWRFWISRNHIHEGRPLLASLLETEGGSASPGVRAKALYGLGTLCHYQGDLRAASETLELALEEARETADADALGRSLAGFGWVRMLLGNFDRAEALSEEALEASSQAADARGRALALNNLGWIANYRGRYRDAARLHGESLALRREAGDRRGEAFALINLAWAERYHGDLERSGALLDEALEILRPIQDLGLLSWAMINRGELARERLEPGRAAEIAMEGLSSWSGGGHHTLLAYLRTLLGCVLLEWGEPERGGELLEEALEAWRALESPWGESMALFEQGCWLATRKRARAAESLAASLRIRARLEDRRGVAECLEAIAQSTRTSAPQGGCVELVGLARKIRAELEAPLPERRRRQMQGCLEAVQAELGESELSGGLSAGEGLDEAAGIERALDYCAAAASR